MDMEFKEFEPFELTIKVQDAQTLKALWLMANGNYAVEEFLNNHYQKDKYKLSGSLPNPIGRYWMELHKRLFETKGGSF